MFTRAEFLEALAGQTSIERSDVYALLGYVMVMGAMKRSSLKSAFWSMLYGGGFDSRLHFLVAHHAVQLRPDRYGGEPVVELAPGVAEIVLKVNLPTDAPAA